MGSSKSKTTSHQYTDMGPLKGTREPLLGTIPQMQEAYQGMANDPMLQQGRDFMGNVLSGKYLDPASNPYLQPYVQGVIGDVTNQFNTLAARAGRGNMTGGDMQQNLARGITSAAAPIYMQAYNQGMGQLQAAAQMAPAYNVASRGAGLDWLRGGLMGVGSMGQEGTVDTTSTTKTTPSAGQMIMGGLMSAASLLNPMAGFAGMGGMGALGGAAGALGMTPGFATSPLGGLLSYFTK